MKILLAHNGPYVPAHDGANKANRFLMEGLAARGHRCVAHLPVSPVTHPRSTESLVAEVLRSGGAEIRREDASLRYTLNGVRVRAFAPPDGAPDRRNQGLAASLADTIRALDPDVILTSCSDSGGTLLRTALDSGRPVIHIARCTAMLGVGPGSFSLDWEMEALLRRARGILTNSEYLRGYLRRWAHVESMVIDLPTYGAPAPVPRRFDSARWITMVNPCAVKGLPILLELARRRPELLFAAVKTWGITPGDQRALAEAPNITLLPPRDDVYEILAETRVLLVPSLWHEAFGRVVVEGLLSGVPVLASDVGGLPEAKLGVPPQPIRVRPVRSYSHEFDARGVPHVDVPEQDIDPWLAALDRLVENRDFYEEVSAEGRRRALAYAQSLSVARVEGLVTALLASPAGGAPVRPPPLRDRLVNLSADQRRLLLRRLQDAGATRGGPTQGQG